MKRFYEECAEAGRCPVGRETMDYLDALEQIDPKLDWIGYCEHEHRSWITGVLVTHDCITMESARRLVAERRANREIAAFVDVFGGYCPA